MGLSGTNFGVNPMPILNNMVTNANTVSLPAGAAIDAGSAGAAAAIAKSSASDKAFADVLQRVYDEGDKKELKKACEQFESIMMSMMYKQMKATIPSSDLMENSQAKEIYEGMLDDELMQKAGSRGIGLADILYKQLANQMDRMVKPTAVKVEAK